jgi:hypothetical protein
LRGRRASRVSANRTESQERIALARDWKGEGMEGIKMSPVKAIRTFFADSERPVDLKELQGLGKEEREELGRLAAKELGVEIEEGK